MQGRAGVPELAKGDRLRTCWRRPTRVRIPAPALNHDGPYYSNIHHMPGWGRWLSYGTVDPATRVRISAPAFIYIGLKFYTFFINLFHAP
jgi:hypothetical protein